MGLFDKARKKKIDKEIDELVSNMGGEIDKRNMVAFCSSMGLSAEETAAILKYKSGTLSSKEALSHAPEIKQKMPAMAAMTSKQYSLLKESLSDMDIYSEHRLCDCFRQDLLDMFAIICSFLLSYEPAPVDLFNTITKSDGVVITGQTLRSIAAIKGIANYANETDPKKRIELDNTAYYVTTHTYSSVLTNLSQSFADHPARYPFVSAYMTFYVMVASLFEMYVSPLSVQFYQALKNYLIQQANLALEITKGSKYEEEIKDYAGNYLKQIDLIIKKNS